jgi:membrane protein required for colicin V production
MNWVDLVIVLVMALAVLGGLKQGFFRAVCSLAGLLLGLALAAWNYGRVAALVLPVVHFKPAANVIAFLLIALVVMGVFAFAGMLLSKTVHGMGLGCLDRLAGAAFGFFQGTLMVTLVILVTVAFFPHAHWLTEAKLPRMFFGACHLSTHMSPHDLAQRVLAELKVLEAESPGWMHNGAGERD